MCALQVSLLGKEAAQLCRQLQKWLSQPGLDDQTQAAVVKAVADMLADSATKVSKGDLLWCQSHTIISCDNILS